MRPVCRERDASGRDYTCCVARSYHCERNILLEGVSLGSRSWRPVVLTRGDHHGVSPNGESKISC